MGRERNDGVADRADRLLPITGGWHVGTDQSHFSHDPGRAHCECRTHAGPFPLLKVALRTIEYIGSNGPIGLTPSSALKRYFVQWAAEAFAWPSYTAEGLYAFNKVRKEAGFPPLVMLRDELLAAKLAQHYKGAMWRTSLAKAWKARPADLSVNHPIRVAQEVLKGTLMPRRVTSASKTSAVFSNN